MSTIPHDTNTITDLSIFKNYKSCEDIITDALNEKNDIILELLWEEEKSDDYNKEGKLKN